MKGPLYFNGKFYSVRMTGVHRVAEELLRAIDDLAAAGELAFSNPITVLTPGQLQRSPVFKRIGVSAPGRLTRNAWEQFELPWRAQGGRLINLCNVGPLASRGGAIMIHDAQIYLSPESHSPAFVAWYRLALPLLARQAACVLTVSNFSRQKLAEYNVAPLEKIHVVPNGVDHILRNAPDPGAAQRLSLQSKRYVLALSNTQAHKNIGVLLRAFEALANTDLKLVLFGSATPDDFIQKGFQPPANVVFAGRVTDAEMRGLMAQALCFACPSLTEGFALPPLEAMLCGVPAIVAPRGAMPEMCGDAALYAAPEDPSAWAATIRGLADDPELWARYAAAGAAQSSQYTWRNSALRLLDVLERHLD